MRGQLGNIFFLTLRETVPSYTFSCNIKDQDSACFSFAALYKLIENK